MRDPNEFAEEILDLLEQMVELVDAENQMLEEASVDLFEPLVKHKTALFEGYSKKLEYLRRFSEVREGIDPDLRDELLELNKEFLDLADRNQQLLEATIETGNQMFAAFSEAAVEGEARMSRYDKQGAQHKTSQRAMPLAFDQEL